MRVSHDPLSALATTRLGGRRMMAIAVGIALNALDGFDVLSISFASPGIAAEWTVDRAALGVLLAMDLIGMGLGSITLGQACDRWGRRPIVICCLLLVAAGMIGAALSRGIVSLGAARILTGIGIGGMLAATNAVVAEHANDRVRSLAIALMAGSYPFGAIVGGGIASLLLIHRDWRSVFVFGAVLSLAFVPVVLRWLPETVPWLLRRQPPRALARTNRTLDEFGYEGLEVLPTIEPAQPVIGPGGLFTGGLAPVTLLLTVSYFAHILTSYFILKWTPKIVADLGYHPASAGGVLVWANVGGMAGAVVAGLLTLRLPMRAITATMMAGSVVFVAWFGHSAPTLRSLSIAAAIASFFTSGAVAGLYAMFSAAFPATLRATGTGFIIGIGRAGAAASPILAGVLFAAGLDLPSVALIMSAGSAVAVAAILVTPRRAVFHR